MSASGPSGPLVLIMPAYKIIIYYQKVKSKDTDCIFAHVDMRAYQLLFHK